MIAEVWVQMGDVDVNAEVWVQMGGVNVNAEVWVQMGGVDVNGEVLAQMGGVNEQPQLSQARCWPGSWVMVSWCKQTLFLKPT